MYNLLRFLFQKQLYSIDLLFYYAAVLLFSCVFELFQVTVQICLLPCTVPCNENRFSEIQHGIQRGKRNITRNSSCCIFFFLYISCYILDIWITFWTVWLKRLIHIESREQGFVFPQVDFPPLGLGGAVGGRGNNKSRQCVIDILIRQREREQKSLF